MELEKPKVLKTSGKNIDKVIYALVVATCKNSLKKKREKQKTEKGRKKICNSEA